jgi:hypothetical protein
MRDILDVKKGCMSNEFSGKEMKVSNFVAFAPVDPVCSNLLRWKVRMGGSFKNENCFVEAEDALHSEQVKE